MGVPVFLACVSRDLHRFLGVGKHYATWVKDKVEQLVLQAGIDFVRFMADSEQGGRRLVEVRFALVAATEIAAAQLSPQGHRLYRWLTEVAARPAPVVGGPVQELEPAKPDPDYLARARSFCLDYLESCREGVKSGQLPEWDDEAEAKIADGFAYAVAEHRRWMLSFDQGRERLRRIPKNAYVIAAEDFPKVLREPGVFPTQLLPEVMNACMERLSMVAGR